jgi:hypothetical protein
MRLNFKKEQHFTQISNFMENSFESNFLFRKNDNKD